MMGALLPCLVFLILFLIFSSRIPKREAFLEASVIWGALVVLFTESLSFFKFLNPIGLWSAWGLALLLLIVIFIRNFSSRELFASFLKRWPALPLTSLILLAGILIILGVLAVMALVSPPSYWDLMTYYMPRVMHWIQNACVDHYPTNYLPQLYQPPFAEFATLHFQILAQGDRFANLIQWAGLLGCLIGVSLIAKQLGASRRVQLLSAGLCASLPIGVWEIPTSKHNWVMAYWLVCFVFATLSLRVEWKKRSFFFAGASLGLALLTKGPNYFYILPFVIWFFLLVIRDFKWEGIRYLILVGLVAVLLNTGYYVRNTQLFGSPMGMTKEHRARYQMAEITPGYFASNIVRNFALHGNIVEALYLKNKYPDFNDRLERFVKKIHRKLEIDPIDPRSSWGIPEFVLPGHKPNPYLMEPQPGNPLHLILFGISAVFFFLMKRFRARPGLFGYFVSVVAGILLFCLLMKWQIWHTRLHLPFFVLAVPFISAVLSSIFTIGFLNGIGIFLILLVMPILFRNDYRPLSGERNIFNVPRVQQYFTAARFFEPHMRKLARYLENKTCRDFGLAYRIPPDGVDYYWEYPFWVMLRSRAASPLRIEHVGVQNISEKTRLNGRVCDFTPCFVIVLNLTSETQNIQTFEGQTYILDKRFGPFELYARK